MFSMNGVDQRKCDLVMRGEPYLIGLGGTADTWDLTGRTKVVPSSIGAAINIVFIGQSTNNNAVNAAGIIPFTLTNPNHVFNGSIAHSGDIYKAKEPLLVSDLVAGHHGMNLGDALVTDAAIANVVLWNIAYGGSWIQNWCPGGGLRGTVTSTPEDTAWRIGLAQRSICNAGLDGNRTIIDVQIGEWGTDSATTQANEQAALAGMIAECKRTGMLRTGNVMFVHQCTRIAGLTGSRNAIRAAQAAVCDAGLVRLGADIDTLDSSNRTDGTHFSTTGAAAQSALKKPLYENFLTNG